MLEGFDRMATPRPRRKGSRNRKRKRDERARRIRQTLIGGGIVMALFTVTGLVALHEFQMEQEERAKAQRLAQHPASESPHPAASDQEDAAHRGSHGKHGAKPKSLHLNTLHLGAPQQLVLKMLGVPDQTMGDTRFRYDSLGLEISYRPTPHGLVLDALNFLTPEAPTEAMPGGLQLPGLAVGGSPQVLKNLFPHGHVVLHRGRGTYTVYDPVRHLAVDFTPDRILAVRMANGVPAQYAAERSGAHSFTVGFDQAFDSHSLMPVPLTDDLISTRIRAGNSAKGQTHVVELHLKVDNWDPDELRTAIKRRVSLQMAAGDRAIAITAYGKNGSKLVSCDWYAPGTDAGVERFGAVDSTDNISYRWY